MTDFWSIQVVGRFHYCNWEKLSSSECLNCPQSELCIWKPEKQKMSFAHCVVHIPVTGDHKMWHLLTFTLLLRLLTDRDRVESGKPFNLNKTPLLPPSIASQSLFSTNSTPKPLSSENSTSTFTFNWFLIQLSLSLSPNYASPLFHFLFHFPHISLSPHFTFPTFNIPHISHFPHFTFSTFHFPHISLSPHFTFHTFHLLLLSFWLITIFASLTSRSTNCYDQLAISYSL